MHMFWGGLITSSPTKRLQVDCDSNYNEHEHKLEQRVRLLLLMRKKT